MDVEQRERALASLYAARDFMRDHPDRNAAQKRELDKLFTPAAEAFLAYGRAGGSVPMIDAKDPEGAVERLLAELTGPAVGGSSLATSLAAQAQASRGYAGASGESSWHLGAGVISAMQSRGIRFGAELTTSGNVPVAVPLRTIPVIEPRAARFVADIIPQDEALGGRFAYWQQTVRTNLAAVVARGGRKPTSIYTGAKVTDEVEVVAHLSEPVNRVDLEDAAMLRDFLSQELEYGLRLALDAEIVSGSATPPHFNGILTQAALQADEGTMIGTCRAAITALQEIDVSPTHFAFAPATWERIEAEAATDFPALPAFSPLDATAQRLHGYPVVVSNAIPANAGMVGDFTGSAVLYRTGGVRVDWSENIYHEDLGDGDPGTDFERNMLVFRAEMRAMLAVLKPAAFLELEFGS